MLISFMVKIHTEMYNEIEENAIWNLSNGYYFHRICE